MEAYKKEPGGKERLKERNPKWINDDYVKFIRMAEDLIAKNPTGGVLGFITNHGYLDNPTFRGMRWHLLKTFNKIWVVDLHGNAKKKEIGPDGIPDKNVFDIQQGVALVVAVRTNSSASELAEVCHGDLWGSRQAKAEALWERALASASQTTVPNKPSLFPFVPRDYGLEIEYDNGFRVPELFALGSLGFQTHRDNFAVDESKAVLLERLSAFASNKSDYELQQAYGLKDNRDWKIADARRRVSSIHDLTKLVSSCLYRPFDVRPCILDVIAMDYPRAEINAHIDKKTTCLCAFQGNSPSLAIIMP